MVRGDDGFLKFKRLEVMDSLGDDGFLGFKWLEVMMDFLGSSD